MSGPDAMHGEMPGFPFPGRPDGAHDEPLLDMIFDRRPLPPGAPQEIHDLARMLATADGPAEPGELAGEAAALAAFSRFASPAGVLSPLRGAGRRRRPRRRTVRGVRGRLAAALVATAAALASIAAAYIGALPGPLQQAAHVTVGAPAPAGTSRPHAGTRGRTSRAHRQARTPAAGPTHGAANVARAPRRRPRRARTYAANGCPRGPWVYVVLPGKSAPDPTWGAGPYGTPRCPRATATAQATPTATGPAGMPSAPPGVHLYTPGAASRTAGAKPYPSPSGSPPNPRH
jgi:hypothetical protein